MKIKIPALILTAAAFTATGYAQPVNTANLNSSTAQTAPVSRERREQAYAKLLEAQRYIWKSSPMRMQSGGAAYSRLAKQALQKAIELDPSLAEAYTALSELAISTNPIDLEEGIRLAERSVSIQPDNFGAHRILARLYTFKSRLNNGPLDPVFTEKAIAEWKEITRLDPRNAEAWAFLSEFYERRDKPEERIKALQNWVSSTPPLEVQFYRRVMGGQGSLAPEAASLKLGPALIAAGRMREAIEVLSLVIADSPDNEEAVGLLTEAVATADSQAVAAATQALQQAVYANPDSAPLIALLAKVQARSGNIEDSEATLRNAAARFAASDPENAAALFTALGDLNAESQKTDQAVAAYEDALRVRGIGDRPPVADDARDFAVRVFQKLIDVYKRANRAKDVRAVITRARSLFGDNDLFADRQLISYYRETGNRAEALSAIRSVRQRVPSDYGLMRLEASLLAENGRVDEGVALVRALIGKQPAAGEGRVGASGVALPMYDDYSNYLFISQLYNQAGRGKEAIAAANSAYLVANGPERKQIAKLTLATAQQSTGDHASAEATLRAILKETPGNPIAMNNLGYFLLERNEKIEEAFQLIKGAVAIDPTNPSYLDSLGWANFKLGRYAEAERHLLEAARYDNASVAISEHLGDVYHKQGKAELAHSSWEKALILASDPADVRRLKTKLEKGK